MYNLLNLYKSKVKNSLSPLMFFFILFNSFLLADSEPNNNCTQVEIVSSLNNSSPPLTRTFSGTAHQTSDRYDYYKFTVASAGVLDFNYSADKTNASLFIGSTCGGSEYYSNNSDTSTKNPDPFSVSAGDTIYVLVERRFDSLMDYDITVNFTTPAFSGSNFKDFSILYTENLRGDIRMIGNTIMGQRNWQGNTVCPGNNTNNADNTITTRHWDIDGIGSTFNSSSSVLSIPAGATIKKAYLYWQGRVQADQYANAKSIKFKQPGASSYTTLTASNDNVHWTSYGNYFPYQASIEVTSLINGSGTYTVADLNTYAGSYIDGLGAYGAWSLIIVYAKEGEPLQNITIYDGYQTIASGSSQNFTLSGFLTPSNGDVNSKFLVFTGEGDVDLLRDYVNMNGTRLTRFNDSSTNNTLFNTFNASITENNTYVTTRNPSCQNNLGIDIHTYNVGTSGLSIIGNNQTSATLQIGTSQDAYYLSVFAFATELYEPRVCYFIDKIKQIDTNTTIFEDKKFTGEVEADQEYTFDIWISNMKKSASDSFIETARLVQVYMNMTDIDYSENSMSIQNLGQVSKSSITDTTGDDLGEFGSDQNRSTWRVGIGATSSQGGTLAPAINFSDDSKKAFITYKGKFSVDDNTTSIDLLNFFTFKASFQTDSITIGNDNAQLIEQCVDLNTSANVVQPPKGVFNVVNENFAGGSLASESDTALFTQVSGQPFNVKIVALENDFQTLKSHTGDVNLSIITTPAYTGDPTGDQALCDGVSGGTPITIPFNGENIKTQGLTISDVMQNASFKISFESNGAVKHVCATDSFAVRPAQYSYTFTPLSPLVGGRNYTLTSTARDISSIQTPMYNGTATQTISLIIPPLCAIGADTNSTTVTFGGGLDTSLVRTGNIGDYNLTVTDNSWASVDIGTTHGNDCIVGSFENTPSGGYVGCNTETSQTYTFNPKDFTNALIVQDFDSGNFTYLSSTNNMTASSIATITARLDNNSTATAYSANCYAKDINTTISLITVPPSNEWLTNNSNATSRILFFADGTTTISEINATGSSTFSTPQNTFNNGIANINFGFNFDRNTTTPDEPFHIKRDDFNLTAVNTSGITGSDFNRTINDYNTTFYYGRVHAPDYRGENDITAPIYYEVYCKDCNKTDFNITGNESMDSLNWFTNALHNTGTPGQVALFNSIGATNFPTAGTAVSGAINNGSETQTLRHPTPPAVDKITMTPSGSWLLYNQFNPLATTNDFTVEFIQSGNWAGQGKLGQTIDDTNTSVSKRSNRRLEW